MKQRGGAEFTDPKIAGQMIDELYEKEQLLLHAANFSKELLRRFEEKEAELEEARRITDEQITEQAHQISSDRIKYLSDTLEVAERKRDSVTQQLDELRGTTDEAEYAVEEQQHRIEELEEQLEMLNESTKVKEESLEAKREEMLDRERETLQQAKGRKIQNMQQSTGGTSDTGSGGNVAHLEGVIRDKGGEINELKVEKQLVDDELTECRKSLAAQERVNASMEEAKVESDAAIAKAVEEKANAITAKEDCDSKVRELQATNELLLIENQKGYQIAEAEMQPSLLDELGGAGAFSEHELEKLRQEKEDAKREIASAKREIASAKARAHQKAKLVSAGQQEATRMHMATEQELIRQKHLTTKASLPAPKPFGYNSSISHSTSLFTKDSDQGSGILSLVRDGDLKGVRITPSRKKNQAEGFEYKYDEIDSITIHERDQKIMLFSNTSKGKGLHSKWTLSGLSDFDELKTDLTTYFPDKVR